MSVLDRVVAPVSRPPFASYPEARPGERASVAIILGTADIPSAIGHALFVAGWSVVMLRDPATPVLRRGMAFDDALEEGHIELDGVSASAAAAPDALPRLAALRRSVVVANFDLSVVAVACPGLASVVIDARMHKYAAPADLRSLAACAIGIGPGFVAGTNVHLAIETLPGQEGAVIKSGATATPTGKAVPLGGAGAERFIYAPCAGAWTPTASLGETIASGSCVGTIGPHDIEAPLSGCVRGLVRTAPGGVARGMKLVEIDPRPDANWQGVAPRPRRIAAGVAAAVAAYGMAR